ncbi:hypothetical protein BU26DRAFT_510721 [Trematosphaeria pertusa]|uniref:Uncharacterized protein n=1 Tax=Trematosphaeria pertusa TaxID=390896 RepID=A0A6A6HWC0_9PLEO|nr:uncharacterized protein BU26DRAFT_510721 [Trematosphaeria pertusa]KAF2242311.1 hypothetical protein BU26DRAFT_510721 [Trematosphaeria pertusa]
MMVRTVTAGTITAAMLHNSEPGTESGKDEEDAIIPHLPLPHPRHWSFPWFNLRFAHPRNLGLYGVVLEPTFRGEAPLKPPFNPRSIPPNPPTASSRGSPPNNNKSDTHEHPTAQDIELLTALGSLLIFGRPARKTLVVDDIRAFVEDDLDLAAKAGTAITLVHDDWAESGAHAAAGLHLLTVLDGQLLVQPLPEGELLSFPMSVGLFRNAITSNVHSYVLGNHLCYEYNA